VSKTLLNLAERDRCSQQDPALRRRARELGHDQERLARERRCGIDVGPAAVREQECAARPAALRDPVGIGEREDRADRQLRLT
jgi:hypothetical protein